MKQPLSATNTVLTNILFRRLKTRFGESYQDLLPNLKKDLIPSHLSFKS